ncbi:MAG: TonB-dependent receptor [Bacteroidales bacterium]|nr:TonB-dependent receptor [Bacteroidales bacterium]MCM1146266.1 TonB-dependent receptor [Bacteroidales bacterium]MCM1205296.1 TonB-dependent receptor [Bacillota bacterium]MCM1509617.1 TonB-dependent receptor [Clostridium sp.]
MQKNKTLVNRAMKAMLVAGFAATMSPVSAFAGGGGSANAFVQAQQNSIKGTVVDEFGEPMIGVTIKAKNSQAAAITDIDGNFSLNAANGAVLEFSYVGYTTQTVKAHNGIKVQMAPDSQMMDEVVVIGFGTVKKRDLTGSVASVKSEAILQSPTSSVASSLQGRITGLDISGDDLRIRGNRSINGSNAPLVIIDGVQGGSMSDLNPNDIESVDVLKDASSTAIYGSQGANGVIIITTKKADKNKLSISYDGYVRGAFREEHPDYRTGDNWYEARRIAAANAGLWNSTDDNRNLFSSDAAYAAYEAGSWTDYEDLLQKATTWSNKHTVTVSGGNDKTSARFSVGYANDGSKWRNSGGTDKYTLRANIDHKINKIIDAGVTFQLTHNRNFVSPYESNTTKKIELGSPYGVYDPETGEYTIGTEMVERPLASTDYVNPLINTLGDDRYSSEKYSTNVVANGYLDIHPVKGLDFRTQFAAHITNASEGKYTDAHSATEINSGTFQSTAVMTKANSMYLEWNNILTYKFWQLPEDHHLSLTALTTWSRKTEDELSATSKGQSLASNLWWNLASNDGKDGSSLHSSNYLKSNNFSYAFRVQYDWKSRYLFTASLRRDGASILAEGHKWDWFPSAALAWRVTDEAWMKNVKGHWLDDLKIRATYGVTGNSGIPVYGTASGVTFANWSFGFQDDAANRYIPGKLDDKVYVIGNKDTKWERSTTFDLGFDAYLFNNRVNIVFDWYTTKTTDLLLRRSLPTSAGQDGTYSTYTNVGETKNTGVEVTINTRNIVKKNFQWNSTLTFSANSEKIVDLIDGANIQLGNDKESTTLMIGHPIKSFQGYKYLGIWTTAEAAEAAKYFSDDNKTQAFKPGDIKVQDTTGDNVIKDEDYVYLGSTSPKWFAGFNNDFKIGNFDVNLYLYARWGQWGESPLSNFNPQTGGDYTTYNYWVAGSNENADFPALNKSKLFSDYVGYLSLKYCDKSFVKLKRITVGYTLPKSALKAMGVQNVRIYATVTDPLYWVKNDWMKNQDPEGNQRSITAGLSVNF